MINADDFYGAEGFRIMGRYLESAKDGALADYAMVGYVLKSTLSEHGTVSRGICEMDADDRLKKVTETIKIEKLAQGARDQTSGQEFSGEEFVSMNFFGFTPSLFRFLQSEFDAFLKDQGQELKSEFYIPMVVDKLIQQGKASVKVLKNKGSWFGITYRDDKLLVQQGIQRLIHSGAYPKNLRG